MAALNFTWVWGIAYMHKGSWFPYGQLCYSLAFIMLALTDVITGKINLLVFATVSRDQMPFLYWPAIGFCVLFSVLFFMSFISERKRENKFNKRNHSDRI